MGRIMFLTGPPRCGKTTLTKRIAAYLSDKGLKVDGMITAEIRRDKERRGFEVSDLRGARRGILAEIGGKVGPRLGKYVVNLKDLEKVGVTSIREAIEDADVIVIDEVGPMELCSEAFDEIVRKALASGKSVLGTIHYKARAPLIDEIKARKDVEIIEVRLDNRDKLFKEITGKF